MKTFQPTLALLTGGLMTLYMNKRPGRSHAGRQSPLRVLYLGPVSGMDGTRGGGGSRTNYVYLPARRWRPKASTSITSAMPSNSPSKLPPFRRGGAGDAGCRDRFRRSGSGSTLSRARAVACSSSAMANVPPDRRCVRLYWAWSASGRSRIGKPRLLRVPPCSGCRARCRITNADPSP
jgi:hypothetical protein